MAVLAVAAAVWLAGGRPVRYGALAAAESRPDSSPSSRYAVERVALSTTTGRRLDCLVRVPARRPPGERFRALLVAGGRRTGRRAALYLDSTFAGLAISCDYPWAEQVRRHGLRFFAELPWIRAEVLATPEAMGIVATYLSGRPETDTGRLAAIGASLGVPLVAAWAARDPRPRAVALLYGGGDLARLFEANLRESVPWSPLRRLTAQAFGRALAPLEPTRTAPAIAPRPLLVVGALDDQWVPRDAVARLYQAAREPKRLVWLAGAHVRTSDAALLATLTDSVGVWLDAVMPGPAATSRAGIGR